MIQKEKWKYSEQNLNLLDSKNPIDERQEMLDIIDESKKKELNDIFETAIEFKYDLYKRYLFESNSFLFRSLEDNIRESVYCLMIGAHTASITNTNLILERAVKIALIQYQAGNLLDYNDNKIIETYLENDKEYSGKSLDKNIQKCLKFKILNKEEADELVEHKLKFRDGFSHFTPKNILKGERSLVHVEEPKNEKLEKYFSLPIYQAIEVRQFAINNAEQHLKYVLKIINHLQYKVLEKFSSKNKPK